MILFEDFKYTRGNTKGRIFLFFFRISYFFATGGILLRVIGIPIRMFYRILFQWVFGIDIPDTTKIGIGFNIWHGQGLIIHKTCIIGDRVHVRHNTTIGQKKNTEVGPVIGNNVDIGAHALIIGQITIGDNCIIGAGTFVNKNIPSNSMAYGSPLVIKPILISTDDENYI